MAHTWDPDRYLTFADERGRPFVELLARVRVSAPSTVVDLGCGPGNLTELLVAHWPGATVTGIDSSPEMIDRAQKTGRASYTLGDVREWTPDAPVDVLISNATLQWLPGHLELLPRLVAAVAPGGWFAFQVPGNFDEPSHTLRHELAAEAPYAEQTAGVAFPASHDAEDYLRALQALGCSVDAWETTYLHVLTGADPVFTWVSGTSLRPTLEALDDVTRPAFEEELRRRYRSAYPDTGRGVVLPFRRIFVVAQVPTGAPS